MSDQPESITHPVLGELRWEVARSVWFAQVRDSTGEWIDVSVEPEDGDRVACLDRAADLYLRAMRAERQLLRTAIEKELLPLYNDCWREPLWPVLTVEQLMKQLEFTFIQIRPGFDVAVILSYEAEHPFAGHCVDVKLDGELRYVNAGLVG
jgi:hypothetical protein